MEHNSTDFLEEFGELEIAPAHEEHLPSENTKPSENTPMTELETIEFNSDSNQAAIINPNAEQVCSQMMQNMEEPQDFDDIVSEWSEKLLPIKKKFIKGFLHTASVIKNSINLSSKQKGRLIIYKDFYFLFHKRELMLLRYLGNDAVVIVPDIVGGIKVTSIDIDAFKYCKDLPSKSFKGLFSRVFEDSSKKLQIDSRLIGRFYNSDVKKLQLPINLKHVPDELFKYLNNLESVEIPEKVKSVGPYAFRGSNVTRVAFSGNVPKGFSHIVFNSGSVLYVKNEYAEIYREAINSR